MLALITTTVIGIVVIVLAVMNMKGNISTLHSYHRSRVKPEDVKPFGKLVGIGTLIIGIGIIIFGALMYAATLTEFSALHVIASVIIILAFAVGLIITFYAMIKYNKGIF